ncbi:MAG: hypothetical protein IKG40_01150 [Bacilli bacterium]|nr:hypothetical protein [Bacilli bacterium]
MDKFNCCGARVLVVTDCTCKLFESDELVDVKKYSLGVIDSDNGDYLAVKFDNGQFVLVEKKYIVINLCDVMQKEVIYSIVNADKAIYNIHGNDIPLVTGKKLYPNMLIDGKLFVPLMFNTAKKLFDAEADFLKRGLTIKIYDTYRPYYITKYLYKILLDLVPEYYDYLNGEVNGHKYDQTDFLAAKTSTHNYGIALDMTLADLNTKEEQKMQTGIHDLSIYSVTDYNNENANMFAEVMKNYGFYPLESEWWHFQDNDSRVDYMDYYISDDGKIVKYDE